jgi:alanyl-tRNA synthetase
MSSAADVRKTFLDYFAKHGHRVVASSPLVPRNDPTLMFTNAGMVQFKNVFTGAEKRAYSTAATSQKCVRAGGKHNDLENVGYTARHHTFFEMLGNFSFGDYFKDRAIELAWNLITKEYGLPKDRLLVTVYHTDDEAAGHWRKTAGLADDKIVRIPTADNFWAMGDTGPCGPCSEIFFDHGPKIAGGPPGSAEADGDRFIEIWNLVFMQFEQQTKETRVPLPKPSIDTGMGLERISAVLQGKHDNYDIDLLRRIILASADASKVPADGPHAVSHRVIADHLRASCFLIADGVLPSNEGRGYVLRRIMRRAMRHAHIIGCKDPLMFRLVPTLVDLMGQAFPELARAQALLTETLKLEETRFKATLERGLKLLDESASGLGKGGQLAGEVAFKLYDTYGFPLDLTQDVLRGRGMGVDTAGFDAAMAKAKAEARKSWTGSGEQAGERVWFELREKIGATEFLGYETESAEGQLAAIVVDGKPVESASVGTLVTLVFNQTPFYAESGGQTGDAGIVFTAGGAEVAITDTKKVAGDVHAHVGAVAKGAIKTGDFAELKVDTARRDRTRANHSATHLLHEALRRRLGEHVAQKGSLVSPDRLRFDIAQPAPLSHEDIAAVEDDVNKRILENQDVSTRLMTPEAAVEAGAVALFGEKYGEEVRVVSMGYARGQIEGKPFSTELCGGTHVRRTGDIGLFKIVSESAVAAGVRRIEAVTGEGARAHLAKQADLLLEAAMVAKVAPAELPARVGALIEVKAKLERELSEARRALAVGGGGKASGPEKAGVFNWAGRKLENTPAKELKATADELKKQIGSGVVALVAIEEGKASVVVAVTDDLAKTVSAVDLVKIGVAELGGKGGGGRPDMAQGGGPDAAKADAALDAIKAALNAFK